MGLKEELLHGAVKAVIKIVLFLLLIIILGMALKAGAGG